MTKPISQKAAVEMLATAALNTLKALAEATGPNTLFWNQASLAAFMCNCGRPESAVEIYEGLQRDIAVFGIKIFEQLPKQEGT